MSDRLCNCGCGKQVTSSDPKVRFICGHNSYKKFLLEDTLKKRSESLKLSWERDTERKKNLFKRLKGNNPAQGKEARRKISEALKGRTHTEEQRAINSKAQLDYWANNPERRKELSIKRKNLWKNNKSYRDKMANSMAIVYNSSEFKNKISNAFKRLWMTKEFREKHSGKNNPNWLGGISGESLYPLNWKEELKEIVRKRDGYICQVCLMPEEKLKRKLHIHHIDYNKENCDLDNLISLCHNDHMRTNKPKDREKWQDIFATQ
jgi:hypothetical protein